jgi:ABC-type antimicrobial peptide transport system permease subunit
VKYTTLREAEPVTIYLPAPQMLEGVANYYVRTASNPAAIGPAIRAAVREIDPTLPVIDLRTQEQQIERRNSQERLFARLSGFFGVAALTLACVGLYGLMSYLVLQRIGEIGLRLALGALPAQVLRMVLRESFALVAVGLVLGLAVAYGVRRFVESMLFGLTGADPLTYAVVAGVLIAITLLASLRPAHRAARVDPMTALRAE